MFQFSLLTQDAYTSASNNSVSLTPLRKRKTYTFENQTCRKPSKVKTGCVTCKERRVKCGEERPKCKNCTGGGRRCGGYELFRFITFDCTRNSQERRSFHYFYHKSALNLGAGSKQGFWNGAVLSAGHLEPAIHHLCIAIGSLHEGLTSSGAGDMSSLQRDRVFALQQYSKASNLLARSCVSPTLLLIACLLFICFEELHTDLATAARHLQSGLDMLCKYDEPLDDSGIIRAYLQPLLLSLSLQYWPASRTIATKASTILADENFLVRSQNMPKSATIEDASENLSNTITYMLRIFDTILNFGETMTNQPMVLDRLKCTLEDWSAEFARFLLTSERMADDQTILAWHLQIRCRIALVLVQIFPFEDEMAFDHYEADFQYIVDVSRKYISLHHRNAMEEAQYKFSWQLRILWPLFIVGSRCRDPILRREAADLLQLYDCQEGPWRSDCIVRAIHVITEIEESGLPDVQLCCDVPRQNRVTPVVGTLLGGSDYMPLSNEKRDRAIRWLQMDYIKHGCTPESPKEHRLNLAPWSRSMPVSFALQDRVEEHLDECPPQSLAQTRRSDMEVLFECRVDLATVCRCI